MEKDFNKWNSIKKIWKIDTDNFLQIKKRLKQLLNL